MGTRTGKAMWNALLRWFLYGGAHHHLLVDTEWRRRSGMAESSVSLFLELTPILVSSDQYHTGASP
jgi:hypothetical protein